MTHPTAETQLLRRRARAGLALLTLLTISLSAVGCGRKGATQPGGGKDDPKATEPVASPTPDPNGGKKDDPPPVNEDPKEPPGGGGGGGTTPTLPNPPAPPQPGKISVSAVATTSSFYPAENKLINSANPIGGWLQNLIKPLKVLSDNRVTLITVQVNWTPVDGAKKYAVWRYADGDPKAKKLWFAPPDNKYMRNYAGYMFTIDGVLPLDNLSLGPNNGLRPHVKYHYVVEAFDAAGTVIARSEEPAKNPKASVVPLDELANPVISMPTNGATVNEEKPLFSWHTRMTQDPKTNHIQGQDPEGYFIQVSQLGVPIWVAYMEGNVNTVVRYGLKYAWHPKLNNFASLGLSLPLMNGKTYAFAMTAVKVDTANNAVAKSTGKVHTFTLKLGGTSTSSSAATPTWSQL